MMAKYFASSKLDVTFLFSGRAPDKFFDMACFGDYIYRRGLTFYTESGRVRKSKTLLHNNLPQFIKDVHELDISGYDVIISDYEPVTAWAGRFSHKTVIGLGHQYAFGHNIPTAGDNILSSTIMKNFAPVDVPIGLHWDHFGYNILPPIIDTSLQANSKLNTSHNTVVVYLPFENQAEVTALLQQMPEFHFLQYSPELTDSEQGNISLRKTCHDGFKVDLCRANAVICNAGFELVSECLTLRLPIMVKPVQGQMEQQSNAAALQYLDYATVLHQLQSRELIENWLRSDKKIPDVVFPDVARTVVNTLQNCSIYELHQLPAILTEQLWPGHQSLSMELLHA